MLSFTRCEGEYLNLFLSNHKNLQTLTLGNLDNTGSTPFAETLELLHNEHNLLTSFDCDQIAQNSFRLYFQSLGNTEETPFSSEWLEKKDLSFFDDFMWVRGPFKYHVTVREWDGVQERIGLLKDDIRVSDLDFHSEIEGLHQWLD